ncbi:MAG: DUF6599 family protein [Candidatus Korobacteraceae bacterium]
MTLRLLAVFSLILALGIPAGAADAPATVFPSAFSGYVRDEAERVTSQSADADQVYAELLREYGFVSFHQARYLREDRKLEIKGIRFRDASGAYGAFTFYKQPEMMTEKIGDQASSANTRVLFYRGNILVEANLDRVTAMSAGELRELAEALPLPPGPERNLPVLPSYLPRDRYVPNTAKYVTGPAGLQSIGAPVPPELVNFTLGAEVATGQYHADWGVATLTLISYPTPQIAGERLKAIEAAMATQENSRSPKIRVASKRSGPIVAVVSGSSSPESAGDLLARVNFDAEVTWSEAVPTGKDDPRSLMLSLVTLTLIVLGMALVAGVAFGGVRLLVKKLYPDRVFDRQDDIEIIQLKLR